jgi:hypothetical protein
MKFTPKSCFRFKTPLLTFLLNITTTNNRHFLQCDSMSAFLQRLLINEISVVSAQTITLSAITLELSHSNLNCESMSILWREFLAIFTTFWRKIGNFLENLHSVCMIFLCITEVSEIAIFDGNIYIIITFDPRWQKTIKDNIQRDSLGKVRLRITKILVGASTKAG